MLKQEAELDKRDKLHPPAPPKRRPMSQKEKEQFERLQGACTKIILAANPDPYLIQDLLDCASFLHPHTNLRLMDLRTKFNNYLKLKDHSAKLNLLNKMTALVSGLQAEANTVRHAMERDGVTVQ